MPYSVKQCATRQRHAGDLRDASHCAGKAVFNCLKEGKNRVINVKQVHMRGEKHQREWRIRAAIFH